MGHQGFECRRGAGRLGDVNHIYRWQERYANAVRAGGEGRQGAAAGSADVLLAQPDYEQLICAMACTPTMKGTDG